MPGGQEEEDGIGAILEEVINRCESKIDLFCSGSRTKCPRVRVLVYIRSHPPLPPPPLAGVDIARELGRGHLSRRGFARYIDCDASVSSR